MNTFITPEDRKATIKNKSFEHIKYENVRECLLDIYVYHST